MMTETDSHATARDRLRSLHDRQQAALAKYFNLDNKAVRQRAALATIETEQHRALGELAACSDPRVAATLTNTSITLAREAFNAHHRSSGAITATNEAAAVRP